MSFDNNLGESWEGKQVLRLQRPFQVGTLQFPRTCGDKSECEKEYSSTPLSVASQWLPWTVRPELCAVCKHWSTVWPAIPHKARPRFEGA